MQPPTILYVYNEMLTPKPEEHLMGSTTKGYGARKTPTGTGFHRNKPERIVYVYVSPSSPKASSQCKGNLEEAQALRVSNRVPQSHSHMAQPRIA